MSLDLSINKIKTAKHDIFQRALMEAGVIPKFPSLTIFNARSGSGKTNLLVSLISRPEFYGVSNENPNGAEKGYFDAIFLMCGSSDDLYDDCIKKGIIKPQHVVEDPKAEDIQAIIDKQLEIIEKFGIEKTPKVLIILDDLVSDKKLMKSKAFLTLAVKGRHYNIQTFFTSQYLNLCPKAIRLNANFWFIFKMVRAELELLCESFTPSEMSKIDFARLLSQATADDENSKHNFLGIFASHPIETMFRKNLDKYLVPDHIMKDPTTDFKKKTKKKIKEENDEFEEDAVVRRINEEHNKKLVHNEMVSQHNIAHQASNNVVFNSSKLGKKLNEEEKRHKDKNTPYNNKIIYKQFANFDINNIILN